MRHIHPAGASVLFARLLRGGKQGSAFLRLPKLPGRSGQCQGRLEPGFGVSRSTRRIRLFAAVLALLCFPQTGEAARQDAAPTIPVALEIAGAQYFPLPWSELSGWKDDDQLAAYNAFRVSCRAIGSQASRALGAALTVPCRLARRLELASAAAARSFFEAHFRPLALSRLGESDGFVTGYFEPVFNGSKTRSEVYPVPVYRRPSNLFVRGFRQDAANLPNKGEVFRRIGRRKFVPYYDRAAIEDGAIAGRGLEICWLRDQSELLFAQIEGSARIRMEDGSIIRLNYDATNGYPYTAVGRILIDRGIIPKEQMSMHRIREWMAQNPEKAQDLRRQNRAYVFFRVTRLKDGDQPVGAQGVQLTAGRSIAVDNALHVYGTPFFIHGTLPIDSEKRPSLFHRLMIAQDTGSAIVGPARADLYLGTGPDAGRIAGRLRHAAHFVMLVPKEIDPVARGRKLPLPRPRPAEISASRPSVALPAHPVRGAPGVDRPASRAVRSAPLQLHP
ncbi:MAG: MltA domain-containing protein [Alphaproteobacteria bacterium]|nr:MltA domain-containing protein [Alphaproteobacteria bacterium]